MIEGTGIKGLMIGIQAGIDNSNTATRTGISGVVGIIRTNHGAGGSGIRCELRFFRNRSRIIAVLQVHGLNTGYLLDLLDLAVGHVGGDDVGSQGQVPGNIQLRSGGHLNPGLHAFLLLFQVCAVGHGFCIVSDILHFKASRNGGFVFQHDGDTNDICVCIS